MERKSVIETIRRVVSCMKDPRVEGRCRHSLTDIIVIVLCGVISGCEGWSGITEFAEDRKEWLETFLDLKNGLPSHDTLERVFSCLWPDEFQKLLLAVASALHETFGEFVSIDGKTLRGSFDDALRQRRVHVVSAYAVECGVTLAQVATEVKSNEITAIPQLLVIAH
jgi:DDE_Tnp_1-associated